MNGEIVSQKPFVIKDGAGSVEYPSQSEADMALCVLLALAGKDAEGIDEEFRKSSLYRDKWERLKDNTIKKALELAARSNQAETTITAQPASSPNATNSTNLRGHVKSGQRGSGQNRPTELARNVVFLEITEEFRARIA
jgi:hypothetical protein